MKLQLTSIQWMFKSYREKVAKIDAMIDQKSVRATIISDWRIGPSIMIKKSSSASWKMLDT